MNLRTKVHQFSLNLAAAAKDLPLPRYTFLQTNIYHTGVSWYMFCYIVNDLLKIFKWTYSLENRCDKESEEKWKKHVLQIV